MFVVGTASRQREGRGSSGHGRLLLNPRGTYQAARGVRRQGVCRRVRLSREGLDTLLQSCRGGEARLQEPAAVYGKQAGRRRPL